MAGFLHSKQELKDVNMEVLFAAANADRCHLIMAIRAWRIVGLPFKGRAYISDVKDGLNCDAAPSVSVPLPLQNH